MKDYRLNEDQLHQLRLAHRRASGIASSKVADRIKSVYLLGSGWSIQDICEALLVDENTIYRHFELYRQGGIKGLLKNRYTGSSGKLTTQEMALLDAYLQEHPHRTTKGVIAYVAQEFEVNYSVSGMNALLKRLDYVYKKPQPIPGKVNKEQQAAFIEMYREIRENMAEEDSLFFMDGVHPHHNPTLQCGWFKRGSRVPVKTGTRFSCININAAVDIDTLDVYSVTHKKFSAETTIDFLFDLREKRPDGWIYLVLDNAGYYDTERIREIADGLAIKLLYLPPYSPNLNLIERLWNYMRGNFLYNRYFKTFDDFKRACRDFMKNLKYCKEDLRSLMTEKFQTFA